MAVLTAKKISRLAVAMLTRKLVLARTVSMVPGAEFAGDNGDTITIRVPQPSASREQSTPGADITFDDVDEVPVDVALSHLYHAKLITDEQASLELVDFGSQVLRVQVEAVARGAENKVAAAINALATSSDLEFAATATEADTVGVILAAREALGDADVPADDRFLAVSSSIATRLLSVDKFTDVDRSGMSSTLRDAVLGRLYGFTVVESPALTTDTAAAYHRSGLAMANRVPVAPRGAADSATANEGGFGLRHVLDYIPTKLSEASIVSTFAGCSAVADAESPGSGDYPRILKIGVGS